MKKQIPALVFVITFLSEVVAHSKTQDSIAGTILDQVVSSRFEAHGPGGVMLVAKHGKIIYEKAFGLADMESGTPLTPKHVFRIASLTKQFTAVSVLQLLEGGKLSLDDRVSKFIPDYPHGDSISISHLLTHTSGIKNITELEDQGGCLNGSTEPAELINKFKNIAPDFVPGSDFHYSNSGYILLGYIIEKIAGQSYERYLDQHIFKPLGMKTAFFDRPDKIIAKRVKGYVNVTDTSNDWKNAAYLDPSGAYAAGALMMSMEDLYTWHKQLFSYRVVKKETLQKALMPTTLSGGQKVNYGFGFGLESLDGSESIQHSGRINGFSSFEIYLPKEQIYVSFFSNAENKNIMGPSLLAGSIVAGKSSVREVFPADKILNQFTGTYQFPENGRSVFISKKAGRLYFHDLRFSAKPWLMHFRTAKSFICYEVFPNDYLFNTDVNGKCSGFTIGIADMTLTLKKVH